MATALTGYDEKGLDALIAAVEAGPDSRPVGELDEALEAITCATDAWELILQQMREAATWDRAALGVLSDGFDGGELTPRQEGARQFLRLLAATVVGWRPTLGLMAADVHSTVWGDGWTEVTWQDVRSILEGRADQPSADLLEVAAKLIRAGFTQPQIMEATGLSKHQVESVSVFLGVKIWRQESKRRAAEAAVAEGLSPRQLAERYSARHAGASGLSERRARELMAEVREAEAAA